MNGLGQGNGFEIRNGELLPCKDTFADGFLSAMKRADIAREEAAGLEDVETADDFLGRTPGIAVSYVEADREPTGLDA
jgi:hypothetical protein